jgi:cyclic pyranopterin phosphate synthase
MDQNMVIEEIRLVEKTGGKSQWAKDLSGKRLLVIAEGGMLQLVLNHLEKLKPSFIGMQEAEGYHMVISTQDIPIQDEFYGLQVIINQTLFSLLPTYLKRGVRIGKDPLGRVVIYIEPYEHIISAFFENFSQLLGTWADG